MLKKRIIIVMSIIMILANFLPQNLCYATNVITAPTVAGNAATGNTNIQANDNSLDDLFYDGLGNRPDNGEYKLV